MNLVKFDPEAKEEFLEAILYYEKCQSGLGDRFRETIVASAKQILDSPFTYRVMKDPFRRYLVSKFPYSLIYSIEPSHIRIIAVAHNKRKPGYWSKR